MNISSKDRFPHIYALDKLGGDKSLEGEKYYEEHEEELEMEFTEIMRNVLDRDNFGGNKTIHGINEKEKDCYR
jgi:hypothetical protein